MHRLRFLHAAALLAALTSNVACAAEPSPRPANPSRSGEAPPARSDAPLPRLFGEAGPVEEGASLQARDADSRMVLWLLGRESGKGFVAAGGEPLRGVANAANRPVLFDALAAKGGGLTVARIGAGTGKAVRVDEADIAVDVLLGRLAAPAGAKGVVFTHGVPRAGVSVLANDLPADAVIAAVAAATNTRIEKGRNLLFVLPKAVALADLPRRKLGPAFSLRVAGASAADVVALLEAAGVSVEGRVPCEAGQAIWLDAAEVRSDEAMRAIRLASGAGDAIGNADACKPKEWSGNAADLAGATPLALVRAGNRAAALLRAGGETWIVGGERLPSGERLVPAGAEALLVKKGGAPFRDTALAAWPELAVGPGVRTPAALSEDAISSGILRATVVDPRRKGALIEDATGLVLIPSDGALGNRALTIEDGRFTLGSGGDLAVLYVAAIPPASPVPVPASESESSRKFSFSEGDTYGGKKALETQPDPQSDADKLRKDANSTTSGEKTVKDANLGLSTADERGPPEPDGGGPPPPPPPTPSRQSSPPASFSPHDPSGGVLWAVEPFREKAAWLGASEKALAAKFRADSWGDAFALALEAALRARGRNAHAVAKPLSDAQIKTLVENEKLRFLIDGELRALVTAGGNASLAVNVRVRKQTAARLAVISSRTMETSMPIGGTAPTDADLLALFRLSAEKAADSVVDSIPQDLFAIRN